MAKNVVLLSDGTGNAASKVWRTNVWRVFESIDIKGTDQVVQYDDGVGSSSFKPAAILGGVFGWGLKRNVLDLYKFACRNYHDADDEIFAFGFSRGAFTIRVVIGLILNQGLVRYQTEAELDNGARAAYRAYRQEKFHSVFRIEELFRRLRNLFIRHHYNRSHNVQVKRIRFLGLWDTVAAYGLPIDEMAIGISRWIWPLELPDRVLDRRVERACHALSLDDERTTFHPVLWDEEKEKPAPIRSDGNRYTADERISQVWFAGMHANVGGGYPDNSLAHVPLCWIMEEAQDCDLRFKSIPTADPDALIHAESMRDKEGRLYDSRSGLGGYYRYGPRKVYDLCHKRVPGRPQDKVTIAKPKIHESALKRMQNGVHLYAPIGLPPEYEMVTEAREIVSPQHNPFETPQQAKARSAIQERVWNLVWQRRVVYFLTVFVSLYLAIYPLTRKIDNSLVYSTHARPISDLIGIASSFLPQQAFAVWIKAYEASPVRFASVVFAIGLLILWSSRLGARITDEMRSIWRAGSATATFPNDAIYRTRTSAGYQWLLKNLKYRAAPLFFAVFFIYAGFTLMSHIAFNFADSARSSAARRRLRTRSGKAFPSPLHFGRETFAKAPG